MNDGFEMYRQNSAERRAIDAETERIAKARTYGDDLSDLYGKATMRFANGADLSILASPTGCVGAPLGRDSKAASGLIWNLELMQGHSVTFGATRSGKGVASIIPALLSYGGSMLVIDPKGENAWATMERRKAMGQRVVVLDPWGEVQRRYGSKATPPVEIETARFNPLASLDPESEDFADDVAAVADALIVPGLGEAHWTDSARELIGGLVAHACENFPGTATVEAVRHLVAAGSAKIIETIKGAAERKPDALSTRKLARFAETGDEVSSVRAVANTQTAIFDSRRLSDSMVSDEEPFNLGDLGTGQVTLYLVLPVDRLLTHGRWLRLIITMAIRAIAKQDRLPSTPVYFCLDEAGTIGSLKMVEQAFGLMAGLGIRISLYLQDLAQLKADYPKSWETFISNSSVIQALKVTDNQTSEYLSTLMGTTTKSRISGETLQIRRGVNKGMLFKKIAADPNASAVGDSTHSRALMLPQEIREDIGPHRVLVILPGFGNYLVRRLPYYAPDSIWKGLYRSPPWFAAANAAAVIPPPDPPPPPPGIATMISPETAARARQTAGKVASWIGGKLRERFATGQPATDPRP